MSAKDPMTHGPTHRFGPDEPVPSYALFPRFLFRSPLPMTARVLYALLLDRLRLSQRSGWTDAVGHVYVIYPIDELAQALGCDPKTVTRSLKALEGAGLVARKRVGFDRPNRIYPMIPDEAVAGRPTPAHGPARPREGETAQTGSGRIAQTRSGSFVRPSDDLAYIDWAKMPT